MTVESAIRKYPDAYRWLTTNVAQYKSWNDLYRDLRTVAHAEKWDIPSRGLVYRYWQNSQPILNPNVETMKVVMIQRQKEQQAAREYTLMQQASWSGETADDRVQSAVKSDLLNRYRDLAAEFGLSADDLYDAYRRSARGYNARIPLRDFLIQERNRTSPDTTRSCSSDRHPSVEPTSPPALPLLSAITRGFAAVRQLIRTCFP